MVLYIKGMNRRGVEQINMSSFTYAQYYCVLLLNRLELTSGFIYRICTMPLNFNVEKVNINRKVKLIGKLHN